MALVGAAIFVLGVTYLNLDRPRDVVVLKVVGGTAVRAGLPASFRVVSTWADGRRGATVEVRDVQIAGVPQGVSATGSPALVSVPIPADVDDPVALTFDIETEGRREALHLTMPVRRMAPEPALPESPPTLSKTERAHRVSILPEGGVLSAGLDNEVFVRVRDLSGVPLTGASVKVGHPSLPDGAITATTDGSGLIRFTVDARRPSFRFIIQATHNGATTEIEELLVPIGRQMLLNTTRPTFTPESPVTARLTTWRPDAEVFCDLFQGNVLVWSQRGTAAGGGLSLELGPWPEGRYSLQCSDHPWALGEAYATTPLLVSEEQPIQALLTELRDQQLLHPSGLVAPPETNDAIATAYWQAILRESPTPQTILLSTKESDLLSRSDAHETQKSRLLAAIALVFFLVLGWMTETILKSIIDRRDRLRAYAAESFMDDVQVEVDGLGPGEGTDRQTILKTRGVISALVLVGSLIANVLGIIWLFALIR
ncbi:MAG: carboxypeptidase-like regulatory domain-containing protein [Myxococcota bacterium]